MELEFGGSSGMAASGKDVLVFREALLKAGVLLEFDRLRLK